MPNLGILLILSLSLLIQLELFAAHDKILSRRKRYLIFPEGSSLQLVYCLTMPVIGKSTIFTIGGTAALAWQLPHDPFQPYRKPAELLHRNDPPGKYLIADPVRNVSDFPAPAPPTRSSFATLLTRPPIRYPAPVMALLQQHQQPSARFPSIQNSPSYNRYRYHKFRRQQLPELIRTMQETAGHRHRQQQFQGYSHPLQPAWMPDDAGERYSLPSPFPPSIYHQVHRRTRRDLYAKIEKFLSAQSRDGKACLLKAVCEMHQRSGEKGSLMEEIMKTVFRAKPFDTFRDEDDYDRAASKRHNCTEMYSSCDSSVLHFI